MKNFQFSIFPLRQSFSEASNFQKKRGYTHTPHVPLRVARRIPTVHLVSGYTLVELVIAVGVFALIMMLASGAYIVMISISRQTQGTATGVNNLSFAIETMTRTIRTGTNYSCNPGGGGGGGGGGDCSGSSTFYVTASDGTSVDYALSNGVITQTGTALTDPSVNVTSLTFYAYGTGKPPSDYHVPRVTFIVSGTVSSGPGKTEPFTVQSGATMRGSDI